MNWQTIGQDDYILNSGDYCLRVEKMDEGNWWWCIYKGEEYVDASWWHETTKTKEEAMEWCEKILLTDKNK